MPGGGAELFHPEIRTKIVRGKCTGQEWLDTIEQAHNLGIKSNATMLYGHIEKPEHIIDHLIKTYNIQLILTGGASAIELNYGNQISHHFKSQVKNLVNQTSLKELTALIYKADFVICPDSGPAHIATAMKTKVIGLYAMSNPLRSGPYLSKNWVINAYPKAAKKLLNKDISELKWGYRIKESEAMNLITPEEVIAKIDLLVLQSY